MTTTRRRPVPADFVAVSERCTSRDAVAEHYRVSATLVARWEADAGYRRPSHRAVPIPADFAAVAPTMTKAHLVRHYRVSETTVCKWIAACGAAPMTMAQWRRALAGVGGCDMAANDQFRARECHEIAANVLRRYAAVFRCDARGKACPGGGYYRVGNAIITPDELLARAERKRVAA